MRNNGTADFNKPTILFGQSYGTKTTVEIDHSDVSLDELFDAFETILTGMGFHKDGIKNHIIELATEYQEEDGHTEIEHTNSHWNYVKAAMEQDEQRYENLRHNTDENWDAEWTEEDEKQFWSEQPPFPFATDKELEQWSEKDIEKIMEAISNPPAPNENLKRELMNYDNYIKNKPKKSKNSK